MTLYEKRGRRYYPAAISDVHDSFPIGAHLVVVGIHDEGLRSTYYGIDPDYAAVEAAMKVAHEAMATAMHEASTPAPENRKLTRRQRDAWEAFTSAMGDDFPRVSSKSTNDIIDAGLDVVRAKIREQKGTTCVVLRRLA